MELEEVEESVQGVDLVDQKDWIDKYKPKKSNKVYNKLEEFKNY